MKDNFKRIICVVVVVLTLVLTTGIAFAYDDGFPYQSWSQFRVLKELKAGNDVRGLQQLLLMQGYAPGTVDGEFGANTKAAVKRYQAAHPRLTVDGIVGPDTWTNMYNHLAFYNAQSTQVSYCLADTVYPWSYYLYYPQDRFYHIYNGAWSVYYGDSVDSWVELRQMWTP